MESFAGHEAPFEYHRAMLDDPARMDAYERAIRALVRPGDVVLDLGSGTGILALLAARRGAARVHAVESMPVAELARELARANGFADRIVVHRANAASLSPVEPVDLIVSDFMGRFVEDDAMLAAVEAAGRWLKPGGRFCPSRLRLMAAPAGGFDLSAADFFRLPLYGLDLSAALPLSSDLFATFQLAPEALLAPPAEYHVIEPPAPAGKLDHRLEFRLARGGVFRGVAGWFEATLAPGIVLSTAPGFETHWGQFLFRMEPCAVEAGDELSVRIRHLESDGPMVWRWEGEIARKGERIHELASDARRADAERGAARSVESVEALCFRGKRALESGRPLDAARAFEAAVAKLTPSEDALAHTAYEGLGLACARLGEYRHAIFALLRALDGEPASRRDSLRELVSCLARAGRAQDARRFLAEYERAFGPSPAGPAPARP